MKGRFDSKRKAIEENRKLTNENNNSFSYCYSHEDKMKNC